MKIRLLGLAAMATLALSCKGKSPLSCEGNDECPEGHACMEERCEQLCTTVEDCPKGAYCNIDAGVCAQGSSPDRPQITGISGTSATTCKDTANVDIGRCLETVSAPPTFSTARTP
jgi:hypothetical protein